MKPVDRPIKWEISVQHISNAANFGCCCQHGRVRRLPSDRSALSERITPQPLVPTDQGGHPAAAAAFFRSVLADGRHDWASPAGRRLEVPRHEVPEPPALPHKAQPDLQARPGQLNAPDNRVFRVVADGAGHYHGGRNGPTKALRPACPVRSMLPSADCGHRRVGRGGAGRGLLRICQRTHFLGSGGRQA